MRGAATILVLLGAFAHGETLDRIAVRVGNEAITESTLRRHLRMEAFLAGRAAELGAEARRKAADRLIDQTLIRRELELNRFAPPAATDVDAQIAELLKARNEDSAALARSLESHGFSIEDLRNEVQYQITLQRFVEFRFSAGVLVTDAEVQEAYDKEVVPEARQRNAAPPSAEDARTGIMKLLTYRKTTTAMEQWLAQARQQVKIRVFEEAFR